MADFYTSYSTSVALRDAGAPQDGEDNWIEKEGMNPYLNGGNPMLLRFETCGPRAFRADEIIEALGDRLDAIDRYGMPGATYRVALSGERGSHVADSLVEALAQAWIVVLKEEK